MLYGIRVDEQARLARQGYRFRVLISYGDAWFPSTCAAWRSARQTFCSSSGACSPA